VTNIKAATDNTPKPGIFARRPIAGPILAGATAAMPYNTPPKTPSKDLTSQDSTQIVMASGNHTINPVSMYFLNGTVTPGSEDDKIRNRSRQTPPQRKEQPRSWEMPPALVLQEQRHRLTLRKCWAGRRYFRL
jgi:hypothetical protein